MNWILQLLAKQGQKITSTREDITTYITEQRLCTFSANDLIQVFPNIDRVTIYRTIDLLKQADIIHPIGIINGHEYFELHPEGKKHHHHIQCHGCNSLNCAEPCKHTTNKNLHHTILYSSETCNACS